MNKKNANPAGGCGKHTVVLTATFEYAVQKMLNTPAPAKRGKTR